MSLTLSDNIKIAAPKPVRDTDMVGQGAPVSDYAAKEVIPSYMRYLFMETRDEAGVKWMLKNPFDLNEWTRMDELQEPLNDGSYVRVKNGYQYSWQLATGSSAPAWGDITGTLANQTDLQNALNGKVDNARVLTDVPVGAVFTDTVYNDTDVLKDNDANQAVTPSNKLATMADLSTTSLTWGSITGTLSNQTDLQLALDNKADTDGNPMARFEVADAVGNNDAVNLQQLNAKVQTDVPAGAVFTDTQIDPQEGLGISIDKTDPMAPIFSSIATIIDVTYEELRSLKEGHDLLPGQHYKITDFKTQWVMDVGIYSGSEEGLAYNFNNAVEPLVISAISGDKISTLAKSTTYPTHVIHYNPTWDLVFLGDLIVAKVDNPQTAADWDIVNKKDLDPTWVYAGEYNAATNTPDLEAPQTTVTAGDFWEVTASGDFFSTRVHIDAPEQPTGNIFYRKNLELNISTGFDYIGYRATRWAVTAVPYDSGKTYGRLATCSVADSSDPTNRAKDALYISMKAGNTGNTPPPDASTDDEWWAVFRPFGEDTSGMYRDFIASDWTDAAGYPTTDMTATDTFGFQVDVTRFQNFPTYGFSNDLTKVDGKGSGTYQTYNNSHIERAGNVMLATNNDVNLYGNYYINLDGTVWGLTIVSPYIYQVTFNNMYGGTLKNYIFGTSAAINIPESSAWWYNNYFEGFSFIVGLNTNPVSAFMTKNIYINKNAARDADGVRGLNGTTYSGNKTLFYKSGWTHANKRLNLYDTNVLGILNYNEEITLDDSVIDYGASIKASSILEIGSYESGGSPSRFVNIKGTLESCKLSNITNTVLEGNMTNVHGEEWDGVTIPSNITLKNVLFNMPVWKGKNTWDTATTTIENVVVSKYYADVLSAPTVEKLWYQLTAVNGTTTDVELK